MCDTTDVGPPLVSLRFAAIITVVGILITLVGCWFASPATRIQSRTDKMLPMEIRSEDYELLESYLQGHPPLKINVSIALADGKITYQEFIDLLNQVEVMDAEAAKTSLRKLLK